jgi:hypothetical protein
VALEALRAAVDDRLDRQHVRLPLVIVFYVACNKSTIIELWHMSNTERRETEVGSPEDLL